MCLYGAPVELNSYMKREEEDVRNKWAKKEEEKLEKLRTELKEEQNHEGPIVLTARFRS